MSESAEKHPRPSALPLAMYALSMHSALLKQTKGLICDAISPLKSDINDLRARMDKQKKKNECTSPTILFEHVP